MPRWQRELRPSTANRYAWMIDKYIIPAIGQVSVSALRAEHLDRLYRDLIDHGSARHGPLSSKTVYDVRVVIRSVLGHAVRRRFVSQTSRRTRDLHGRRRVHDRAPKCGLPSSWPCSSRRPVTFAFTQLCISPLRPACGAARSVVFVGPTGTDRLIAYRSRAAVRASVAEASRSRRKRRRVDGASTWTRPPRRSSTAGTGVNDRTDHRRRSQNRCSPTRLAIPSIRSDSRSSSIDRSVGLVSLGSVSTICATRTPRCLSPSAHRSRSSPSASATLTRASRWRPTSTSCLAWVPVLRAIRSQLANANPTVR